MENSIVELRLYLSESKQSSVKNATTDRDGNFDLATVAEGQYRLLASPTRLFEQAGWLECDNGDECKLDIVLRASATDMPANSCPVR